MIDDIRLIDGKKLIEKYADQLKLSPMNSGCTLPFPHPRGRNVFMSVTEFPFQERRKTRPPQNNLVEIAVSGMVPDVADFIVEVRVMQRANRKNSKIQ